MNGPRPSTTERAAEFQHREGRVGARASTRSSRCERMASGAPSSRAESSHSNLCHGVSVESQQILAFETVVIDCRRNCLIVCVVWVGWEAGIRIPITWSRSAGLAPTHNDDPNRLNSWFNRRSPAEQRRGAPVNVSVPDRVADSVAGFAGGKRRMRDSELNHDRSAFGRGSSTLSMHVTCRKESRVTEAHDFVCAVRELPSVAACCGRPPARSW